MTELSLKCDLSTKLRPCYIIEKLSSWCLKTLLWSFSLLKASLSTHDLLFWSQAIHDMSDLLGHSWMGHASSSSRTVVQGVAWRQVLLVLCGELSQNLWQAGPQSLHWEQCGTQSGAKKDYFLKRCPLLRQGKPTGNNMTGSALSAPRRGLIRPPAYARKRP